jgi:hypothetical protein
MKIVFNPLTGNFETLYDIQTSIGLLFNLPCDETVYSGAVVRINQNGVILNAIADSPENSNVLGIVESKASDTICNVRLFGVSKDIFNGLDVSKQYYLSNTVAGGLTDIVPSSNNQIKVIVGIPLDDKRMFVVKSERQIIQFQYVESGSIDLGSGTTGDLSIDTGDRTNDSTVVDQGLRVIEGI